VYTAIIYETSEGIATITLNRPEVLNAINVVLSRELTEALARADQDPDVRVVILKGAGRAFSAGADLKERFAHHEVDPEAQLDELRTIVPYMKIWDLGKPVIASVHGYCLAGACQMAGMCDLTIASDDAVFGEPEVKFTNPILMPITALLLNPKKAREFLYLGERWAARDAQSLGLVNRVVPRADLEAETLAVARKLAAIPPAALRLNKRAINKLYELMGFRIAAGFNEELLAYVAAYQAAVSGTDREADDGFRREASSQGLRRALGALHERESGD